MKCTRCGRPLKHARASGMGPKCELAVLGPPPKKHWSEPGRVRVRLFDPKPRDPDPYSLSLFEEQANA